MRRIARQRAYGLAAEGLRLILETDAAWPDDMPDSEIEKMQDAAHDLIRMFRARQQPPAGQGSGDE